MRKIRKNGWAFPEKKAKMTDGQTDTQSEKGDFIGPFVGPGSRNTNLAKVFEKLTFFESKHQIKCSFFIKMVSS